MRQFVRQEMAEIKKVSVLKKKAAKLCDTQLVIIDLYMLKICTSKVYSNEDFLLHLQIFN